MSTSTTLRRPTRWRSAVVVGLFSVLALSACGGNDDSASGGDKSTGGGDAETVALTKDNFASEIAKAQKDAKSAHMAMSGEASGQKIEAEGDIAIGDTPQDVALSMTMSVPGLADGLEMRLVDQVFYMNLGPMTENKFAKIDLTDSSNPIGAQYGQLVDQFDPSKQMETFQEAVSSFEQKGDAKELDGVETTPYVMTIDTQKLLDVMKESGTDTSAAAGQMPDSLEYTAWIGDDNLIRRMSMDLMGVPIQIDYTKWGEDVSIEKPAAFEISDKDPFAGMSGLATTPSPS